MWPRISPQRSAPEGTPRLARGARTASPSARLSLEALEARDVPSAVPMAAPNLGPALFAPLAHHASPLVPISITGVTAQNGQLLANGLIGSQPFTAPVTMTASPGATAGATPILNLHLGAIHLDLLGLHVDTSEICLNITAQRGPGNLLGNLLSDVAGLLNGGSSLGGILSGLTSTQLSTLTNGVTGLLNGALGRVASAPATPLATDILHLSLGPVHLNLLGLKVNLDNCAGGPITLDVSAVPGEGLLGNLLGGLAHAFDNLGLPARLSNRLDHIAELLVADAALLGL